MVNADQLKASEQAIIDELRNAINELKQEIEGRIDEQLNEILTKINQTLTGVWDNWICKAEKRLKGKWQNKSK